MLLIATTALIAARPNAVLADDGHGAEAAAHGGGHAEAAHGEPSPLAFNPSLAIWTLVVFTLLLAVLWKFAWGPISQALDLREQKIADNIAAAEQSALDAKRMLADYETKLAGAREEVRAIIEEARRDAEQAGQDIVAKARTDAAAEVDRGKREIETATSQALKELAETSANLAVELAGRIVSAKLDANYHANLISQAMSKFPKVGSTHN